MAKKENFQPLDVSETMVVLLEKGRCISGKGIKYGDKAVMFEKEVEEFCNEYNKQIAQLNINNPK